MKKIVMIVWVLAFCSCSYAQKKSFSEKALTDTLIDINGQPILFKDVLAAYKGKTIVTEIWASWCKDCLEGMPALKALQDKYKKDVVYLFLSLDKSLESWRKGIMKYDVQGEHYFLQSGRDGPLCTDVETDWIPRYLLINKHGGISLPKAIEANDDKLIRQLDTLYAD